MNTFEKEIHQYQQMINNLISPTLRCIQSELDRTTRMIKTIDYSPVINSISNASILFSENYISDLSKKIEQIISPIRSVFDTLPIKILNYQTLLKWADYGWGLIEELPKENTYYIQPDNPKHADSIIEENITEDLLKIIIEDIRKNKIVNSLSFDEAVDCFYLGKYTACILILYSIIDSFFLNIQTIPVSKKQKRDLANGSAKKILMTEEIEEFNLRLYARAYIPLQAITILFTNGEDFKSEPDLPNRNFVSHGMNQRRVSRIDCIKVISIIRNLFEINDIINLKKMLEKSKQRTILTN